jgi:peptidoglycan/xylan/chitin deacetylase (PgdA/CDA1 family)
LGKNITGFAYPYGNYNELTKSLLQQEGYAYAVSTEEGCVTNDADRYSLPRIQVKNWDIDQFSEKIQQLKKQTA